MNASLELLWEQHRAYLRRQRREAGMRLGAEAGRESTRGRQAGRPWGGGRGRPSVRSTGRLEAEDRGLTGGQVEGEGLAAPLPHLASTEELGHAEGLAAHDGAVA